MRHLILGVLLLFSAPSWATSCWATYYESIGEDGLGNKIQIFGSRHGTFALTSVTATQTSSTFPSWVSFVRLICDIQVFYEYGASPTATIATIYLPANTQHVFEINGSNWEVAVCDADCT